MKLATFTLELWKVLELYPEGDTPTYANIGLNDYPIFDRAQDGTSVYRPLLNQKIVNHFHNREIGQETISMFKFAMKRKMHEIMPIYNALYKSTQLEFDPLVTVDVRTVVTGESSQTAEATGVSENNSTGKAGSRTVQSQTPAMLLAGNKDYATAAADATSDSENVSAGSETSNTSAEENTNSTSEMKGYQGNVNELLMAYRATLLNVDMMIIDELNELFMGIWNNGDEYFKRKGLYY
jgi:hypothetical protein